MHRQTLTVTLLGLALIGSIAWYLVSPIYAMSELHAAAVKGDIAELEQRIDFPAFRESVKTEFRAQLEAELEKEKKSGNSMASLGSAIAISLINELLDQLVTPEGVAALLASGKLGDGGFSLSAAKNSSIKWNIGREGISRFFARAGSDEDEAAPSFVFEREGFGWKLVGISFGEPGSQESEQQAE